MAGWVRFSSAYELVKLYQHVWSLGLSNSHLPLQDHQQSADVVGGMALFVVIDDGKSSFLISAEILFLFSCWNNEQSWCDQLQNKVKTQHGMQGHCHLDLTVSCFCSPRSYVKSQTHSSLFTLLLSLYIGITPIPIWVTIIYQCFKKQNGYIVGVVKLTNRCSAFKINQLNNLLGVCNMQNLLTFTCVPSAVLEYGEVSTWDPMPSPLNGERNNDRLFYMNKENCLGGYDLVQEHCASKA